MSIAIGVSCHTIWCLVRKEKSMGVAMSIEGSKEQCHGIQGYPILSRTHAIKCILDRCRRSKGIKNVESCRNVL